MSTQDFINDLEMKNIIIWLEKDALKYKAPKGIMTNEIINSIKNRKDELLEFLHKNEKIDFCCNTKARYEKFPLTDIQNSYVMGRNKHYELGGVACHGYVEMTYDEMIDSKRLEAAWNKVIQKHDMLRAIISGSGYQIVQEAVPYVEIEVIDLNVISDIGLEKQKVLRKRLSEKQYKLGDWPMCDIALTIEREKSIIHLSLDMLIADFVSTNIILNDLDFFYRNPDAIITSPTLYRDVVIYQNRQKAVYSAARRKSETYWNNKIKSMGEAPDLPMIEEYDIDNTSFSQKKIFLNNENWTKFCANAKKNKITPSMMIMSSFAEVLSLWSSNNKFCINTTILNRPNISEDIYKIAGDFTDVNVTAVNIDFDMNFLERSQKLQRDLWGDLEHNAISGVEVLRKLTKDRKKNIIIPVVYTSTIGMASENDMTLKKHISYKISQTPQVYIDCQASEENNGATVNWDIRNGVFEKDIIDAMFESFQELIQKMCIADGNVYFEKAPVQLPVITQDVRIEKNNTDVAISPLMMEEGFLNSLKLYPNKTALITADGEYTYAALSKYVAALIQVLEDENLGRSDVIGINIKKNVWQIAAVLAILIKNGTYVPIDISQPVKRKEKIVRNANAKLIFSDRSNEEELKKYCNIVDVSSITRIEKELDYINPKKEYDRPAYIIYTSGTTGEPKGVIISHRNAMNTICDVNECYGINNSDVFLGLANLSFDLSVYDIFGAFLAGAALVLPNTDKIKDPKYIAGLLLVHDVTIWNSVPAQMQMIVNYIESNQIDTGFMLRTILLSGDWIPVNLPKRIYDIFKKSEVVSLGGATEASIWSIYFNIPRDYNFEKSIPYGIPMANQRFYILNRNMQHCPDYVDGSLYIGGTGLSLGYLNDDKLNKEKYVQLPETGERIYKTGDKGHYTKNGIIIFKGRDDGDEQVKIHGHRVELAEIRSVLNDHPYVDSAVTLIIGETQEDMHINAAVTPVRKNIRLEDAEINAELKMLKEAGDLYESTVNQDLFESWNKKSDEVVVADIFSVFRKVGIFKESGKVYPFADIANKLAVPEKLHKLVKRWIIVLIREGILSESESGYELVENNTRELDSNILWKQFYEIENEFNYSIELVDYLKKSSDALSELIQGKEDPLNLLFPKGETDPAMAAYHDNKINKILNGIAKDEIVYSCNKSNQENKDKIFRILEVGAGVGGTSLDVIPELEGYRAEYYFTDLSTFFLNKAQSNLSRYNWVKYGIFDINVDFIAQGYEAFSFDVILCANVLHNSKNVHNVIENLKGLLAENGSLVILEETKMSYMLLTSMEFKDGLTGFDDERRDNEQTFFTRAQWESIFERHNGRIIYEFPPKESKLDLSGQTFYVTRFTDGYETIRKSEIRIYLEETISSYMVPSNIIVLPNMPLTTNKKVDLKKIEHYFTHIENSMDDKKLNEPPQSDLEKRIARIWCEVLKTHAIGRNDNFYLIGGDSLLIAQVIGNMLDELPETKGWEWSSLLTEMMQAPTIKQIAEKLDEYQNDKDLLSNSCFVQLRHSSEACDKSTAKVVFHAGTGTLTPYNTLLSYIDKDCKDNESVLGFTFGDDAEYISMDTKSTFKLLGAKYGQILKELGYSNYILIGHCVGGLIALEAAQFLRSDNISVSDVTLISSNIPVKKENTRLSNAPDEIYRKTVQSCLDNELLLERIFAKLINADIKKAGYHVNEERLQNYLESIVDQKTGEITVEALCNTKGEYEDVAAEFRKLASKSVSERLNALYNTIERPNGNLLEHQLKMLNILFRIFSQNFRCVATYEPAPYYGNLRVFNCETKGGHFYPGFFEEDYETWKPYAKGKLHFDTIQGWHLDCIEEPNLKFNSDKLLDFIY